MTHQSRSRDYLPVVVGNVIATIILADPGLRVGAGQGAMGR